MAEEVLQLVDSRQRSSEHQDDYKSIHITFIQKCKTAKETWLNGKCKELGEQREDPKSRHKKIRARTLACWL